MVAHTQRTRQNAYEMWVEGYKASEISRALRVDYDTLLGWVKRFKQEGSGGLSLRYQNCGRRSNPDDPIRQRAIAIRKQHPQWGAEYIRLNLEREFEGKKIVCANQIRRWLKIAGLMEGSTRLPQTTNARWADRPLRRVQVDAKERLHTADGNPCCYLNFIDEHSGAALDAFVFPLCPNQSDTPASYP